MVKVFSTPDDPSHAIAEAISKIGHSGKMAILHGTTVGTNALLQRKGAKVAFVTTRGFEDSIEIGRQARPKLYDFFFDAISPLVEQDLRFGVMERTDKDGNVLQAPASDDLEKLVTSVRKAKPESIALSLLFSFANPKNEKTTEAALRKLKLPVSVSSRILPEFREYERANTVVVNAYLQPVMERYLTKLQARFRESRVFVMQSSGGLTSLESAAREPVRTVLSGPAGGVVGAVALARRSGYKGIIGFDMGGTSTDVCLVEIEPATTNESELAGSPIRVPMLNIHTVGAGGGSLARFDSGGALRVGPESAGAEPGPICYGRGTQPTVSDANLLLGRLQPNGFLGGAFALQEDRTLQLTKKWLREQVSNWTPQQLGEGIVRVVNANMEKAIRVVSVEKGYDPRDFSLVAFGGAGALHACELANALEIPRVIVPYMPGALSAVGILLSNVVKDYSQTLLVRVEGTLPRKRLDVIFAELIRQAKAEFKTEDWKGKIQISKSLDMRYHGQGFEIVIPDSGDAIQRFHREHRRRFGYSNAARPIELVTVRLRAQMKSAVKAAANPKKDTGAPRFAGVGEVIFNGQACKTKIMDRSLLAGKRVKGPAIITEYSATTVVAPGWWARKDGKGNLVLESD